MKRPNYKVEEFIEYVDFSKTVEENLTILREHGFDMTEHTFHVKLRGKVDEHARMKQEIYKLIDIDFTVLENQKKAREHGHTKYTSRGLIHSMILQKKNGYKEYDPKML